MIHSIGYYSGRSLGSLNPNYIKVDSSICTISVLYTHVTGRNADRNPNQYVRLNNIDTSKYPKMVLTRLDTNSSITLSYVGEVDGLHSYEYGIRFFNPDDQNKTIKLNIELLRN